VRRQTSWNTAALQEEIIGWLCEALEPFRDRYTPVLRMDAAPAHVASNALRACVARSIHVIVVPAQMTWLLQPLDTHAFRLYKATFMRAFQTARARADTRHLKLLRFSRLCTAQSVRFCRVAHGTTHSQLAATQWDRHMSVHLSCLSWSWHSA
jgi:hypothetical protein